MNLVKVPYLLNLQTHGWIEGTTIKNGASGEALCHYFGGIPYALPPVGPHRWRQPRPLGRFYKYGTRDRPGRFIGPTNICPQSAPHNKPDPMLLNEDCLQTNMWLPPGKPPEKGWPVYFYIHGGSLQFGSPNDLEYSEMLSDTNFKAVVVSPAYRLNVFGFFASRELLEEADGNSEPMGNFGFWDQRCALEWTRRSISYFSGDPSNITIAGYSAGAHSVFYQLSYDLKLLADECIIRRAIMHSNSCGMQPKLVEEAQLQFDELLAQLNIPLTLASTEKLARLRETNAKDLVAATMRSSIHEFRSVSDGVFIRKTLFRELEDGTYARAMTRRNIGLWIGECRDEHFLYRTLRPPKDDSIAALRARYLAEYPRKGADGLMRLYFPDGRLPAAWKSWQSEAFGHVWADIQVHMLQRGFISCLVRGGASDLIHRYRIEWRAQETDAKIPRAWGVTHSTDNSIWVYGEGRGLDVMEKETVKAAFLNLYARFVAGEDVSADWGTDGPHEVRRMKSDGNIDIWRDEM